MWSGSMVLDSVSQAAALFSIWFVYPVLRRLATIYICHSLLGYVGVKCAYTISLHRIGVVLL